MTMGKDIENPMYHQVLNYIYIYTHTHTHTHRVNTKALLDFK